MIRKKIISNLRNKKIKKETKSQRIARYESTLSKKDLAIMLVNTQDLFVELAKALERKLRK
jgi:galactitol-specific phosphotransferase system IIB component